jgi:Fe-S-cluster containining protein
MDLGQRYRDFDVALGDIIKRARTEGHAIPCERGCDACCYDIAVVSHVEMTPVMDAIRALSAESRRKIRARMMEWLARAERAGIDPANPEPDFPTWAKARLKCPLLQDHECMIYDARPMACRGHHVVDETPDCCAKRAEKEGRPLLTEAVELTWTALRDIMAEAADPASNELPIAMGLLPTMLLVAWDILETDDTDAAALIMRRFKEPGNGRYLGRPAR